MDIVLTSATLMEAEGGAIACLDPSGTRLEVGDIYASPTLDGRPSTRSFSLPLQEGSGWQNVVRQDRSWWSEIDDARFTEGFKNYHDEGGRRFFAHFPFLISGEPTGFLGLAFAHSKLANLNHSKVVQLMADHVGLLFHTHREARISLLAPTRTVESSFRAQTSGYIDAMITESKWNRLKIADIANNAGYSVRQFHLLFVKEFGETPHAWILQRRLALALELLLEKQPVWLVAYRLGFTDQAHFAKSFRAHYGYAPSDARTRTQA